MVGASCVNAVSEYTKLFINIGDGEEYSIEFSKGVTTKKLYKTGEKPDKDNTGTKVLFKLDKEIWKEEWYNFTYIKKRLRQLAYLNPGLTINFNVDSFNEDKQEVKITEIFNFPEGLIGYINKITTGKEKVIAPEYFERKLAYAKKEEKDLFVDTNIAFVYTDTYSSDIKSFVNNVGTDYGGDHEIGFKNGLYNGIKKYLTETNAKELKLLASDDCQEGLQAIISIKLKDPNFEGQGKGKLRMPEIRTTLRILLEDYIYDYLSKDKARAKLVMEKIAKAAKAREAAKRARNAARGLKNAVSAGVVESFADCSSKKPEECEIYLVEGDSAGGSAKQARDRHFQAILPVFGKILNAEKSTLDKVMSSPKLADLVKVLKTGIGEEFDLTKLRYQKVILMSDAD